jgi:hypothetical protein
VKCVRGIAWHNHTGDQTCHPQAICTPESLDDLVELVRHAESHKTTVHAVGSGHAWSEVALTDGLLVLPDGLRCMLDLDDGTLRPGVDDTRLVRVASGTRLRELNAELDQAGLALTNMGGYDEQTIAGVIATSTHGSGLTWGPFPSMVRSMDIVVAHGDVVRVEPSGGITDPGRFAAVYGASGTLTRCDDTFNAAVCGLGLMGLVHSFVVEVRERFWLKEVRTLGTWEGVRDELTMQGVLAERDADGKPQHYELFLNPYADCHGKHRLLVTRRSECPDPGGLPLDQRERHPLTEMASGLPVVWRALGWLACHWPRVVTWCFNRTLKRMCDDSYANISYRVFNIGAANLLPAYSMELAVSLEDDTHLKAIERILEIADRRRRDDGWYHTSPIALRFVASSTAYASMMYERPTMMIELIMIAETRSGKALLAGYEAELADLGVRAHWGQFNTLTAERVAALYPRWDDWLGVQRSFNSSGVFDTELAQRLGV